MAVTALYRLSSNEVIKISTKGQPFDDRDTTYWGVLTDPTLLDGDQVRDNTGTELGPLRQLGFAKLADPGTNTIRNATQAEIDTFSPAQINDEARQDADEAANLGDTHPRFRKLIKSMLKGIVRENNVLATRYNTLRSEMLASTNLNDLQTRIQNNTQDAPIRTNQQAFDAIRNDISKDD